MQQAAAPAAQRSGESGPRCGTLQVHWGSRQQVRSRGTQPPEKQRTLLLCINSVTYGENERREESLDHVLALGISQGHWWLCDSSLKCVNH